MTGDDLAFPLVARTDVPSEVHTGLTKRELFALMTLTGLLANVTWPNIGAAEISEQSIKLADALISELNKEQSE